MGYFVDGEHFAWGDPIALLKFPKLSLTAKFRYGLQMFLQTKRRGWDDLEKVNAKDWFIKWIGPKAYDVLWRRLLELKFFEYADNISAAWMATRIKRVGTSRKSLLQEELGVIDGGSQTLVDALVAAITRKGGTIRLGTPAREIVARDGQVFGVRTDAGAERFDRVISTVPTPYVAALIPALPEAMKGRYDAIKNIGVVCVLLKLTRPVSRHFWLNINDKTIDIPGIVEFSNLRRLPNTVVYIPYYMPQTHQKFSKPTEYFIEEAFSYIEKINPALHRTDLIASHVGRLRYAQPVCEPGFLAKIPPVETPIKGLQVADTCYYYPEDRGISESVRFAKLMVERL